MTLLFIPTNFRSIK